MKNRKEITTYCCSLKHVYQDYPFSDPNMAVIRHRDNKKIFACIFSREDKIWVNLKCDPEWIEFWRSAFSAVIPAYHMNKRHWNSLILDGTVPIKDIKRMVMESYDLTKPTKKDLKSDLLKKELH